MSALVQENLFEKMPIIVNGRQKFATGLNKQTTVDDIKYAMLSVTEPEFTIKMLSEFAIVEKWQSNERILDGHIRIHKLLRMWQSVPGNQLEHVQFIIKKKLTQDQPKLTVRDSNEEIEQPRQLHGYKKNNKFAFCTLSPDLNKTWNVEKAKRSSSQAKSSYVKRQLLLLAEQQENAKLVENSSSDEEPNRYASIKRFNRSKKCTIKKINDDNLTELSVKSEFIDLVKKQNLIIDKQLNNLAKVPKTDSISTKLTASIVKTRKKIINSIETNNKQRQEVSSLNTILLKMDDMINLKTKFIDSLENELKILDEISGDEYSEEKFLIAQDKKTSSRSSLMSKLSSKSSIFSNISYLGTHYKSLSGDCESDTGISSAGSDDSQNLETLV